MLDFFQTLISYVELVWGFFLNLISSLLSLITALVGAMIIPQTLYGYMWGPIGAAVLAVTAFSVVKMLIGRNNV